MVLSGSPITLGTGGLTLITGGVDFTIGNDISLSTDQIWLNTSGSKTLTLAGAVSGAFQVTKTGPGVLKLSGANTYSGATTVSAGTLNLDFNGTVAPAADIIPAANSLTLAGGNLTVLGKASASNAQTFGSFSIAATTLPTITLTPGAGGTATLNLGVINRGPSSGINLVSTGTISTSTGTASTLLSDAATGMAYATVNGVDWAAKDVANATIVGLSTVGGYTPFDTATVTLTGNADLTSPTALTYTLGANSSPATLRNTTITGNTLALGGFNLTTGGILSNSTFTISGTGSLQPAVAGGEMALNQSLNVTTITSNIANNTSASAIAKTGAGTVAVSGSKTYTGATNVLQGSFQMGSAPNLGGASATLATSGINVATGATFNLGSGTLTATQNITGPGNFQKGGNYLTNGTINGTNNNYTGTTTISVNTLTLGANATINGTSSISVSAINNAVLANNGTITTTGAVTVSGGTSTTAGIINNGNSTGTTPGVLNAAAITLNSANGVTTGSAHGGAFTNNLSSLLTVSGTITVNGEGSATAAIPASAIGSTFTNAGGTMSALAVTLVNSPVTNTISNKGGTFTQTGGSTTVTNLNLSAARGISPGMAGNDTAFNLSGGTFTATNASLNGLSTVSGTGAATISGQFFMGDLAATRSGNFVQTGGTVNLTTTTANSIRIAHWGTETSAYSLSGGTLNATGTTSIVGYDGTGILNISEEGAANLKGLQFNRGFGGSGTLNLTGGRLNLGTGGATFLNGTGASYAVNLGAGTLGAFSDWTSALAMTLTDPATATSFNTLDSVDALTARTITLTGVLSGVGGISKTGAGTLVLTNAANIYAGPTTVSEGTLLVNGTNAGTGAYMVESSGSLGGNGTISGAVTVAGNLAPGNASIGTLTTSNLTLSGIYSCDINGTAADNVVVEGLLDLTGSSISSNASGAGMTEPAYTIATYAGVLVGTPNIIGAPGYVVDTTTAGQVRLVLAAPGGGYSQWAGTFPGFTGPNATPVTDFDNDGIANLLEYVLGGDPRTADSSIQPQLQVTATDFVFTFTRSDDSEIDTALTFQWGTSLQGPWTEAAVPAASGIANGATFTITENTSAADTVIVAIPRGTDTRVFGRLKATKP